MPEDVSYGSNKKVWWIGKCGHLWLATVKNRSNGSGCPYCSGNQVLYGLNDLESRYPEIAAEWSEKNYPKMPSDITVRANKKVWWKCASCGYEWQARVADRTDRHGCPVCAGAIVFAGYNDLATRYPELAAEWAEDNDDSPSRYSPKSRKKVRWKCNKCGYKWEAVINTRVHNPECPSCRSLRNAEQRIFAKVDRTKYMENLVESFAEEKGLKIMRNDDAEIGVPLAIFFPEERVAIEFSRAGQNQGPRRRWENAKNWLCVNASIRMIRILAPGAKAYSNCECIRRPNNEQIEAYNAVKEVMERI